MPGIHNTPAITAHALATELLALPDEPVSLIDPANQVSFNIVSAQAVASTLTLDGQIVTLSGKHFGNQGLTGHALAAELQALPDDPVRYPDPANQIEWKIFGVSGTSFIVLAVGR